MSEQQNNEWELEELRRMVLRLEHAFEQAGERHKDEVVSTGSKEVVESVSLIVEKFGSSPIRVLVAIMAYGNFLISRRDMMKAVNDARRKNLRFRNKFPTGKEIDRRFKELHIPKEFLTDDE
jgi:hypothetical protein